MAHTKLSDIGSIISKTEPNYLTVYSINFDWFGEAVEYCIHGNIPISNIYQVFQPLTDSSYYFVKYKSKQLNPKEIDDLLFKGSKEPEDPDEPLFPDISDKHYSKQTEWETMWDLFHKINK